MKVTPENIQLQILQELGYYEDGKNTYHKNKNNLFTHELASSSLVGRSIMSRTLGIFIEAVDKLIYPTVKKPGAKPFVQTYLSGACADKIAYITLAKVIDALGKVSAVATIATKVGQAIEVELRLQRWLDTCENLTAKYMIKQANEKSMYYMKVAGLKHKMKADGVEHTAWPSNVTLKIGLDLISSMIETIGLFEIKMLHSFPYKTTAHLVPTDVTKEWIENFDKHKEYSCPRMEPSIIQPKDWTGKVGGGLYNEVHIPNTFIKKFNSHRATGSERAKYFDSIDTEEVKPILSCLNALQHTAWKVNKPVLDVLSHVWKNNISVGSLPEQFDIPLNDWPFGDRTKADLTEEDTDTLRNFKRERMRLRKFNMSTQSKRISIDSTIRVANRYAKEEEFFLIWTVDFRGRYYPLSNALSPQTAEWSRALLTFKEGVAINTAEDLEWLCIHGANCAGQDKIAMQERVRWVYQNSAEICRVAADPLGFLWWTQMDKPFMFLAFCFEWAAFTEAGFGFVSHLPCYADGTANGIQHLSAILRDERGGRAVNMGKSKAPNDLYANVADEATRQLEVIAATDEDQERVTYAKQWLAHGLTRKITKRAVMITPYAGTQQGARGYIEEAYLEGVTAGKTPLTCENKWMAFSFLTQIIWGAIHQVVSASKAVMGYIKEMAKVYAEREVHFRWKTPTGLMVTPMYFAAMNKRIETCINGKSSEYTMTLDNEKEMDVRSTVRAASPNLIHSMDAAALTLTVNACVSDEIVNFAVIHDSYGTHSSNMPKLGRILRECFVEMYLEHNILEELRDQAIKDLGVHEIDLPDIPKLGTLDLHEVMDSEYFFS